MDSKTGNMGILIVIAIGLIVGLIMLQASSNNVAQTTDLVSQINLTITVPAANASVLIYGQDNTTSAVVTNSTGTIAGAFYTIYSSTESGSKLLYYKTTDTGAGNAGIKANLTYTYQPVGYITDSGGRAMSSLILVVSGIALLVFSLYPTLKEKWGF